MKFLVAALFLSASAAAQEFPSRPIRYVVPLPPGGGGDFIGRIVAEKMGAILGKPMVVENRGGASGAIGAEQVARAPADGHTLLQCYVATHGTNPAVAKLQYDAVHDFAPVGMIAATPNVLVVHQRVPAASLAQFVALAKARPKSLTYASTGLGTATHLTMEYLLQQAAIEVVHVPYKGAAPAMTDLLGGQVDSMFPSLVTALPHLRSGKIRALALSAPARHAAAPDVPTVAEAGYPAFNALQWYGICAPAKTPAPVLERLNAALNAALAAPEVKGRLAEQAADVMPTTPEAFGAYLRAEVAKWTRLVRDAKLQVEDK